MDQRKKAQGNHELFYNFGPKSICDTEVSFLLNKLRLRTDLGVFITISENFGILRKPDFLKCENTTRNLAHIVDLVLIRINDRIYNQQCKLFPLSTYLSISRCVSVACESMI